MIKRSDKFFDLDAYLRDVEYRIAQTPEDKARVYETVYKAYVNRGYICEENHLQELFPHRDFPGTRSFFSLYHGNILTTATVIPDSHLGLPMDAMFKQELDALRDKKICEVSMLASNSDKYLNASSLKFNAHNMRVLLHLFKHILDYVKVHLSADYICISVNPKHQNTYKSLFFKDLGAPKLHTKLKGAPAIAKFLNVHTFAEMIAGEYGIVWGHTP